MSVRTEAMTMDCRDERRLSAFWTGVLGYDVAVDQPDGWMVLQVRNPNGMGTSIGLQVVLDTKAVKNLIHLDLVPTEGELEAEIRRLERLGARWVRYVENDPNESHWIMADLEGDELCCVRLPREPRLMRRER